MRRHLILVLFYVIETNTQLNSIKQNNIVEGMEWNGNFKNNIGKRLRNFGNKRPRPEIRVYYESKCPDCVKFYISFTKVVQLLGPTLDIATFPYGNAQTIDFGNGTTEFQCQHGPEEYYGNKLHACVIEQVPDYQKALILNGVLIETGSTDAAADQAAAMMGIDSEPIKYCAKSYKGSELLKIYGIATHAMNVQSVPYVLINGVQWDGELSNFMGDVCAAFTSPPAACRPYL